MTEEAREIRLKRLRIRSWRRGTREMDLLLGTWSDRELDGLNDADLDLYEELLAEQDPEIYDWFTGRVEVPIVFQPLVKRILGTGSIIRNGN
ncbi:MAG: succinate dehydrogenase assembly factor 2 [Pseudomonadota bacterium]